MLFLVTTHFSRPSEDQRHFLVDAVDADAAIVGLGDARAVEVGLDIVGSTYSESLIVRFDGRPVAEIEL